MNELRGTLQMSTAYLWDVFQSVFGANKEKRRIYREMVSCQAGARILDFGCATGITAAAFSDCNYLGVDINAGSILWAQRKYRKSPNIKFICCDVSSLKERSFDHILCAGTGHHLTDVEVVEIHKILQSLLVEGGVIHFIDIVRTERDSLLMRGLMAIDQGRHVRTASEYDKLFDSMRTLRVVKRTVLRSDGWYTKPSFIYLLLAPR